MTVTTAKWKEATLGAMEVSPGVYFFVDNYSMVQTTQKALGLPSVVKLCLLLAESRSKSKTIILCSCSLVKALTWAIRNFLLNTHNIMQYRQLSACKARDIQLNAVVFHLRGINRACSVKPNRRCLSHPTASWDLCLHHTVYERTESPQTSILQTTVLCMGTV